jgi:hypothetical protein
VIHTTDSSVEQSPGVDRHWSRPLFAAERGVLAAGPNAAGTHLRECVDRKAPMQ